MRKILSFKILLLVVMSLVTISALSQDQIRPLWEGDPPYYQESDEKEISEVTDKLRISKVQRPGIYVYLPSTEKATGDAVLICPGGGYGILAWDWEGGSIARWLNTKGIAGIVLKYRLPSSVSQTEPHKVPLTDAQRAMRLVRHQAKKWGINPERTGIMGFSAGGHLASTLSTHFDDGNPGSTDPVEKQSCRPDFSILMYPVITMNEEFTHMGSKRNLLGDNPSDEMVEYYSNDKHVSENTPPAILIHSTDDGGVPVENSIAYYKALKDHGVSAALHVYPYGGHGFALAENRGHLATWTDRVLDWINYLE